ncbi:MAG: hypothetical protein K5876_02680 [Ruminiclostridium sp.]|nr:hypothetical protein [Ruminiclostridium sp.]
MAATSVCAVTAYADDTAQPAVTAQAETQKPKAKNVKVGKVTAVNGSEITLALGEFAKPEKPSDSAEAGDNAAAEKKEKPEKKQRVKPSDSSDSTADETAESAKPSGRRGKHKSDKKGEFTENGSTLTITLTDGISLKKGGKTVTAADIAVGDILTLKYNDSGELVGIKVSGEKKTADKAADGTKEKRTRRTKKTAAEQTVTA